MWRCYARFYKEREIVKLGTANWTIFLSWKLNQSEGVKLLFANSIIIIIRTMTDLGDIVRELKPTVLIGAAAIPKVS